MPPSVRFCGVETWVSFCCSSDLEELGRETQLIMSTMSYDLALENEQRNSARQTEIWCEQEMAMGWAILEHGERESEV